MKISKLIQAATEKHLKKLPPNTEINNPLEWSQWDGLLALVDGPSYYDINGEGAATETTFDPKGLTRRYRVRFATSNNKRLPPPNKAALGHEIAVNDRSQPYWKITWTIGRPGYGPLDTGTFEKDVQTFLVDVPLKALGKAEIRAVTSLYDSYGYVEIGGYNKLNIKLADWKKLFSKKKFVDTQDLDANLANAAYELLFTKIHKHPKDETEEQLIWESIQGIYKTSKNGEKLFFILGK